jgi:two-component system LytT family response regulator
VVPVEEVDFFTASGSYVEIHAGDERHLIRETMSDLEESLDPTEFCRVHRSHIVRLDRIESVLVNAGGNYAVRLRDGRKLKVSRSRKEELEDRLGLQR